MNLNFAIWPRLSVNSLRHSISPMGGLYIVKST